jgi:hypothetical protein
LARVVLRDGLRDVGMKTLVFDEGILDGVDGVLVLMLYIFQNFVVVFGPFEFRTPYGDWFCLGRNYFSSNVWDCGCRNMWPIAV